MSTKGLDEHKYRKIYEKKGVMTKKGGLVGEYGSDPKLDEKWDRYGHANEARELISEILIKYEPLSIVDIGCGHNEFLTQVRKCVNPQSSKHSQMGPFIGVDIACPGADVIAPAHILPFSDNKFDMLVSFDCMEHIPEEEVVPSILEFKRVAKSIYLKISLTDSPTLIDGEPVHVCVKPADWWLQIIRQNFEANAEILHHARKNTPHEHIVVYAKK